MRSPQPPIPKPANSPAPPESHVRPGYETPDTSAGAAVARRARCPRRKLACFCSAPMAGFYSAVDTDELAGREPHDFLPRVAIDAVILVLERDAGAVAGKQAAIGDGDTVGIARQIGQRGLRAAEGAFAVDHPFDPARWRQIFREGIAVRGVGVRATELQAPGGMGGDELFQKQPAEQPREDAHRQEEARPAGYPPLAVQGMPPPGTIMWTCGWWV